MTSSEILWEYRQIVAIDYERKTGKPYRDNETRNDPEFQDWLDKQKRG